MIPLQVAIPTLSMVFLYFPSLVEQSLIFAQRVKRSLKLREMQIKIHDLIGESGSHVWVAVDEASLLNFTQPQVGSSFGRTESDGSWLSSSDAKSQKLRLVR